MLSIRYFLARFIGGIAALLSRVFTQGTGEQIQGRVIDALCHGALKIAASDTHIIVVSATNGKTTTTRLIAQALATRYENVISNALGANQRAGVLAALVNGKKNSDERWAVLEVDERSLPTMFKELNPDIVVLGNLSRDQLDRFGEVSSISHAWKEMFSQSSTHVIANGCDPHIVFATSDLDSEQVTYVDLFSRWHDDAHTCPVCGELLTWDEQSHFRSPTCGFSTPKDIATIDNTTQSKIDSALSLPGSWNVNNAILAREVAHHCGLDDESIFTSWKDVLDVSGRNAIFHLPNERTVQLFLAKNPAGWNETLSHISNNRADVVVFAFNCNIADGKDPSWLYDVDFENADIDDVVVFGERATDMIVRLNVASKTTRTAKDVHDALNHVSAAETTHLVASYTQFLALSRLLPKLALSSKEKS